MALVDVVDELKQPEGVFCHHGANELALEDEAPVTQLSSKHLADIVVDLAAPFYLALVGQV